MYHFTVQSWWPHWISFSPDGLTEFPFYETALDVACLCSDYAPCDLIWQCCDKSDAADTPLLLHFFSRLLLGCWWSSPKWSPTKTARSPWCPMEPQRMFMPTYSKMITTTSERCEIGTTVLWGRTWTNDVKPDWKVLLRRRAVILASVGLLGLHFCFGETGILDIIKKQDCWSRVMFYNNLEDLYVLGLWVKSSSKLPYTVTKVWLLNAFFVVCSVQSNYSTKHLRRTLSLLFGEEIPAINGQMKYQ